MDMRYLIIYPVLITLLACLIIPFLPASRKSNAALFFVLLSAISSTIVSTASLGGQTTAFSFPGGLVFGDIAIRVDPLSAWFILLINVACINGAWYGSHYMKAYLAQRSNLSLHWSVFVLLHISMIWICSIQHGLAFLVAWEVMSLSAFLLVMFDYTKFNTLNAGINYLVQTHIGVAFLTIAFIWVWVREGSFGFGAMELYLNKPDALWLFLVLFIGFGIKAGFIPLHTWLPHAHPAAPAHISGVLSGVMVTMGVYGIARMAAYLTQDLTIIGAGMLTLSVLTAFYGILSAAIHRDYKRILAFSTIENMGIVGMGIGIGLIGKGTENHTLTFFGFSAALLHVFNHSLYKPLLFFASGNIYQFTHTRNIEHLGGLIKKLPFTAFFFLCGALAVGGLPPFNGFVSKFLLFSGLMEGIGMESFRFNILMMAAVIGLALVGGLSVLSFTKSFGVIFLGVPRAGTTHRHAETFSFGHIPLFVILFLMLTIGLSPTLLLTIIERIVYVFDPGISDVHGLLPVQSLSGIGLASFIFVLTAALVYFVHRWMVRRNMITVAPTWGCGYPGQNKKMQYTGKAFSKSLAKLFGFITSEEKKYQEIPPKTVFVTHRSYHSSYGEFFEKYINIVLNPVLNFMNYFTFIHNGRVQYYVLYGFIFMLMLIVATFSNLL
ncbi:MAG: proton-conducting transporter membrane subunit [Cyclobacteriaceae bacterium]